MIIAFPMHLTRTKPETRHVPDWVLNLSVPFALQDNTQPTKPATLVWAQMKF